MAEDTPGSPLEIREVAEKAFELQRYLLRRAWGVLYATWTVPIFLTVFGGEPVVGLLGLSAAYTLDERIVVGMLASGTALTITLRAFKRVRDTAEIHNLIGGGKWKSVLGYRVLVPIWVLVYVILLAIIVAFGIGSDFVLLGDYVLGVYVGFWLFLYYAQGLSFPGRLPAESIAVLSSFGVAIIGSVLNDLSLRIGGIYVLLWGATIITWGVSARHARRLRVPTQEVSPGD